MIKIKRISNEEEIHYFKLELNENFHNQLIAFLDDLNFSDDDILKVDTPFSELSGEYIYLHRNSFKIHLFIEKGAVNMVIDSKLTQEHMCKMMSKHFIFPKWG